MLDRLKSDNETLSVICAASRADPGASIREGKSVRRGPGTDFAPRRPNARCIQLSGSLLIPLREPPLVTEKTRRRSQPMPQQGGHSSVCLGRPAHWNKIGAGYLLRFPPLGRSYAHMSLERALERRLGLIADRIGHCTRGHGRLLQFIGRKSHADVGQEITGRSSKLLLEVAGQRRARCVAKSRKLRQRPRPRRLVK
jgi:hypothetical protein